jgi:recombination protein RecT
MTRTANNTGTKNALVTQEATAGSSGTMTIAKYLEAQKPAIMAALPRNIDVDRFTRIVLTAVRTNPDLLSCDPMSILAATMQSAQLGLEPGSGLGEAYIIPYKREATFQMGYKGLVKLARNSGDVTSIWAEAVYEGDLFRVVMGSEPKIEHVPDLNVPRGTFDNVVAVYAVARLATGDIQFAVMTKAEIEQHRNRYSRGYSSAKSPWSDPLGAVEMAKKTVVLRLCKMLPLSAEVSRAIASDGTIRRELSADMTTLPDVEDEKVPPEALGAVELGNVDQKDDDGTAHGGDTGSDTTAVEEELPWNRE